MSTRPALFASSLASDLVKTAEAMESDLVSVRIVAESLRGLPRIASTGAVAGISKDLADAIARMDHGLRQLREVTGELRDFVR
jgi:hypothetical protein